MATNNQNYQIIGTRDFSCPDMTGFTFKYPVFKGWEPSRTESTKNKGIIFLNQPKDIKFPVGARSMESRIEVTKSDFGLTSLRGKDITENNVRQGDAPEESAKKNRHGILYDKRKNRISFWAPDFKVEIIIEFDEGNGFSKNQFSQAVIESFRLINISQERAIEIARKYSVTDLKAGEGDINEMLSSLEDKGDCYSVYISPKNDGRQNFEISMRIDKFSGEVSDAVVGTLKKPRER